MIHYPQHQYFIYDGQVQPTSSFIASENAGGVYEVLRVAEKVPLFLEEHLERFFLSARLAEIKIRFSKEEIERLLWFLIGENKISEGNILLSCKTKLKAFFIPHKYPDESWYQQGVNCGLLHAERKNPNAKVFQTSVRQQADELMAAEGYYEVLLVDHLGRITEGSRSNVFFVAGNRLLTPPGNEVLLGITRQKTIQLAQKLTVPLIEEDVFLKDLHNFDAAFITGTSPKILPLSRVSDRIYDPKNQVMQHLREEYERLIRRYISSRK